MALFRFRRRFQGERTYFLEILFVSSLLLFVIRQFSTSSQLFEQINISSIVGTVAIHQFRSSKKFKVNFTVLKKSLITALAISFVLNISLLNIDRSRSFYVLSWVENGDIKINANKLVVSAKSEESRDTQATLLRLNENESRGLIEKKSETFQLTWQGRLMLRSSNTLAWIFDLKNWNLNKY